MAKNAVMTADQRRQEIQRAAWDAYNGNFPNSLAVRGKNDDNIKLNRCGPIVDKGASALFGKEIHFQWTKTVKKTAQKYIDDTWAANRKQTLLMKLAISGGVTGQPMLRLHDISPDNALPRITIIDASTVTITTAPDDIDKVLSYTISYTMPDPDTGEDVKCRQLIAYDKGENNWLIVDQTQDKAGNWNQQNKEVWNYPFAPIVDGQNLPAPGSHWGKSDVTPDIIQMNRDVNYILSNLARVIRFHAFPKTVASGFDAASLRTGVDGTLFIPNPEGKINLLEMKGDIAPALSVLEQIFGAMDALARVPSIALGILKDMPRGTVSGLALQVLYEPLVEKTGEKQCLYGDLINEVNRRLLAMASYQVDDCKILWDTIVPKDLAGDTLIAQQWKALGLISKTTILQLLGLDLEIEAQNILDEKATDAKNNQDSTPDGNVKPEDVSQNGNQLASGQPVPANAAPPAQVAPNPAPAGTPAAVKPAMTPA